MLKSSPYHNRFAPLIAGLALLSICAQSWVAGGLGYEQDRTVKLESSLGFSCFQRLDVPAGSSQECCCRETSNECCCSDCHCAVSSPWVPTVPAIPIYGQSIGDLSLACCSLTFWWTRSDQIDSNKYRFVSDDSFYKTAQQTCALLSRFTC